MGKRKRAFTRNKRSSKNVKGSNKKLKLDDGVEPQGETPTLAIVESSTPLDDRSNGINNIFLLK